ncbi:MAG: MFS transporter [Candidatus Marinimicrobia bacterium]|nr:MFS transporter [Candidatus Neomarinimicrobiota bacterium]MCF7880614.1 MFS transporter [Candidatus Neomarinimicrobiota bacterium]
MEGTPRRLSIGEKIGFSFGDTAANLYFQTFIVFLPIFYTDVFGLPAAAMGTMFLVTRIWDAVNDPLMGMIADRTRTRWGKFRPYIALFAVPLAIVGVITFSTPDFGETGKLIYAYVTYALILMFYTAVNVPYSALMGVISPNSLERTEVSTYRFVAAFVGQFIVGAATLTLVEFFGQGNPQVGWPWAMGCFGVIAAILLFITFFSTKERVLPPKGQQSDIRQDLKDLFKNKPWLLIAGATVFQLTYIVMRGSSTAYYFRYFVQEQQLGIFGYNINLSVNMFTSSFITIGTVSTLIGALLTMWFSKRLDKKNTYSGFLITSAVFSAFFYFLQPHNVILIYLLNILVSFFFGSVSVLQWAMYTDTADYGEWKMGRRATGLIMAASLFALKLGLTLGGSIVGWVLGFYGFVPNVAQTPDTLHGIVLLMSAYPAIIGILGGSLMLFYPLTNDMMIEIEEDLEGRRGDDAAADPVV